MNEDALGRLEGICKSMALKQRAQDDNPSEDRLTDWSRDAAMVRQNLCIGEFEHRHSVGMLAPADLWPH